MESTNDLILLVAIGSGIMLLLALAFVLFFSFSQNKLRKEQFKAQEAKLQHQEQLLHSNIKTQEEERERIAKDLHDEVGSKLNVIHLYLHQLLKKQPEAKESVSEMITVLKDTIQTSRRISHDLLPPTLDKFGLAVAIEELSEVVEQANDLQLQLELEGERPQGIDKIVEINLFRVLQELISNTLKYAKASEVRIKLWQNEEKVILNYADNGLGFDPDKKEHQKGLGMKNIESRLQMIGAELDLKSSPGKGVQVQIESKLNPAEVEEQAKVAAST
ncbi:MAG: sensor histidine kinase [Bacteroidia bacterium]|nr:sensor histidine kinase [Bacteroidia bacterium]